MFRAGTKNKKFPQNKERKDRAVHLLGSLAKGFSRKVCGNSAETSRKVAKHVFCCVRKGRGNLSESLRNIFCNHPFPNDLMTELLKEGPKLVPQRPFLRRFCDCGPGGPGDSCKWRLGSQRLQSFLEFLLLLEPWELFTYSWSFVAYSRAFMLGFKVGK